MCKLKFFNKMEEYGMSKKYIMALDQGTTSSRAILFDKEGNIIATSQKDSHKYILSQVG